jgi:hypothetical protein
VPEVRDLAAADTTGVPTPEKSFDAEAAGKKEPRRFSAVDGRQRGRVSWLNLHPDLGSIWFASNLDKLCRRHRRKHRE